MASTIPDQSYDANFLHKILKTKKSCCTDFLKAQLKHPTKVVCINNLNNILNLVNIDSSFEDTRSSDSDGRSEITDSLDSFKLRLP